MYQQLRIENFKSIKSAVLNCKKVNIFIGEPNAGKSNIVEAISLFSRPVKNLNTTCRFRDMSDLFFDNQTGTPIAIILDDDKITIDFKGQNFRLTYFNNERQTNIYNVDVVGTVMGSPLLGAFPKVAFYKFDPQAIYNDPTPGVLKAPYGSNLGSLLLTNESFKALVRDLFKSKGFRLNLRPVDREILLSKEKGDELYSYSFANISETLRRIVFFMAILETNKDTTLIFDEPEANTFPFYTKYLAERIALDESNQYFFTTHNPYLLRSVVEKTKKEDLNVCITHMENYETKLHSLTESELDQILDVDVFFNLDLFLKK